MADFARLGRAIAVFVRSDTLLGLDEELRVSEITTWVGVAASGVSGLVTLVTVYLRSQTKTQLAAIQSGSPEAARIVSDAVTTVQIDTTRLTKEGLLELARQEIEMRDRRNARRMWTALGFTGICAVATVVVHVTGGNTYFDSTHIEKLSGSATINMPASTAAPASSR